MMTVYNWMSLLGFKYSATKKTYYVDGHEKPDVVAYRKEYCNQYVIDELRCFRWIQLSKPEVEKLEKENIDFVRDYGYEYKDNTTGLTMFEFHVDDHESFHKTAAAKFPFGGNLSVRKKEGDKPIIMIGQDESVYKQYLINSKQWNLPDGTTAVNPKDEGHGIMLSSFVSRDFGYGWQLTPEQLLIVNTYRNGKTYTDEIAALEVIKQKEKTPLETSPFIRKFEYGANSEGYWNYNHMVIQFEDVVDVLKALFADKYEYLFYFDHSSGHDRLRPDGLNVKQMNKTFGGNQQKMRNSTIKDATYLGPFEHAQKLMIGDEQCMSYKDTDTGPFYLSEKEKEEMKYDVTLEETETRTLTRMQLIIKIQEKTDFQNIRGNLKKIQSIATSNNIPLEETRNKVREGWCNKPKGMLQVL